MKTKEGLIDELDEIVYISDTNTYELLYLNRPGRSVVGVDEEEYRGKKCYQVLQGRQEPCPFCTNGKLTAQGFYVWESANTYVDRRFIVKDKLVEWEGRTARMELAIDITEKENISQELRDRLEIANALIDCVSALVSGGSLDRTMAEMLRSVGEFYQADRVYIFEADCRRRLCSNTYEWCAPGVTPQRLALQNVPLAQVPRWVRAMEEKRPLIIGDLEEIREKAPQEYRLLRDQDIHSVGVMPFGSLDSPLAGYIGVDNPARFLGKVSLLESLSYFVMTEISKDRFSKELAYLGEHDTLTGLYNRNHYSQYLEDCQHSPRQRSSMGVMAGDINGLKRLNTDLGHAYGDRVVREVAGILLKNAPSAQSFRLGGDEFFLLWEDVGYEEFLGVMQRIKEELRGMERASVSIGYTWSDTDVDLQRLADHADELMLLSKQKYRRQAASGPGRSQAPLRRLLDALEKHRFLLYLQPKMQVSTGALAGAEALVRFEHPRHGIIPPDRFIPVLEKEQTIRYVDFFMLEEVYRTLTRWQEQGRPLVPIALNFSRATLLEPDLLEVLREVHSRYRVPRRLIQIEITESIGEVERETIARISTAIRKMGYSISLDDFGAKYTSISLLTMMRFDVLKLDRSLVEDLTKNRTSRIIVENVLRICRQLEVVCVAEGVETPAQLESLRELCCDQIQGYLFGRPMPLSDFEEHYMQ